MSLFTRAGFNLFLANGGLQCEFSSSIKVAGLNFVGLTLGVNMVAEWIDSGISALVGDTLHSVWLSNGGVGAGG